MGVHEGHRQRLKKRFAENGLKVFDDVNALELLLFYAVPRRDTNVTAHRLLERFGSLAGVFEASREELCEVEGVGERAAELIMLVPQAASRYLLVRNASDEDELCLTSEKIAGAYAVSLFTEAQEAAGYLVCLDPLRRVTAKWELPLHSVPDEETVRRTVETAVRCGAAAVMIMQRSSDEQPLPNSDDLELIRRVVSALSMVQIQLADYIIVSGSRYCSLAAKNLLRLAVM